MRLIMNRNVLIILGLVFIISAFQVVKAFEYFTYEEEDSTKVPSTVMGEEALMKGDVSACETDKCLELKAKVKKTNLEIKAYTEKLNELVTKTNDFELNKVKKNHRRILDALSNCTNEVEKKKLKVELRDSARALLLNSVKANPQVGGVMQKIKSKKLERDEYQRLLRNAASLKEWHESGLMEHIEKTKDQKDSFYHDATNVDLED